MKKKIRVEYNREVDKKGIEVYYYVDIIPEKKCIRFGFHPILPEGMHWKAGDDIGVGFDYLGKEQSFEEFKDKPHIEIHRKYYIKIINIIKEYS